MPSHRFPQSTVDGRRRLGGLVALACFVGCLLPGGVAGDDDREARKQRLAEMRREITRLESELSELAGREQGLLGELERLGADLRLREKEHDEVALQLEEVTARMATHDSNLEHIGEVQDERRRYLAFRIREIYKAGSDQWLRRFLGGAQVEAYWRGMSYASYLSARDAEVLEAFRGDVQRESLERNALEEARAGIVELEQKAAKRRDAVASARRKRSAALRRVREDQGQRRAALEELQAAAGSLSGLIESLPDKPAVSNLDMRKFKGLLEWPADGNVSAGFGKVVHPRFGTEVPHPGWDIDAGLGADIASVFGGTVVFAEWMRGYGLTAIVDHGNGLMSIYAHASALLVGSGQVVKEGQTLGKVGDTGSLRGPYLYFELRVDGRPVDPAAWLRRP